MNDYSPKRQKMQDFKNIDVIARAEFLDILRLIGEDKSFPEIKLEMWHRAYREQISYEQTMKLGRYLFSDDFFIEVEHLLFYHYKDGTNTCKKELNHIYQRSITIIHEMN